MELKSQMKALNYTKRLLTGDTDRMLPWQEEPQKPAFSQQNRRTVPLPRSTPEQQGVSSAQLEQLVRQLAEIPGAAVHNLIVIRHGRRIFSAGFAPYSPDLWHVTHSLCKSVTGTAIGLLWDEGNLKLDEPLSALFPEHINMFTSRRTRMLTVRNLLAMCSGVNFREAGAVLEKDWVRSFFEAEVQFEPGTRFDYNSMNSYLLAAIVRRRTGQSVLEYLTPRLFDPLGFGPVAWETCPLGTEKGGWGMYMMPEDMGKLALLYLNGGVWHSPDGTSRRILSESWVRQATTARIRGEQGAYGYQMWPLEGGAFTLNGMFGQYAAAFPQTDTVVVLNSGSANLFTDSPAFTLLKKIFRDSASFSETALPDDPPAAQRLARCSNRLVFGRTAPGDLPAAAPLRWYQRLAQKLLPPPPPAAPTEAETAARLLAGRSFTARDNRAGLLPLIVQCMQGNHTPGLQAVSFVMEADTLTMRWQENNQVYALPLCFDHPCPCVLEIGGEEWRAAAVCRMTHDEDDHPVLKLLVCLPEHSSTRILKFFLLPEGVQLQFDESPSMLGALRQMEGNPQAEMFLQVFKDISFARHQVLQFCCPRLELQESSPS